MILDLFIYIIQFYINQNTFLPGFIIRKEHVTDNTYEWCAQGVSKEIDNLQGVDMDIINWWYDIFDEGKNVIIQDVWYYVKKKDS